MSWFNPLSLTIATVTAINFGSLPALAASSHPYDIIDQFAEVLSVIEEGYVEPPARDKLGEAAIAGMVGALDPHSVYMPADQYEDFRQETSGRFAGIGVEVDLRNGQVLIVSPIPGSPAEVAGLQPGDRILTVDGIALDTIPLAEIVHRMRGIKGTAVHLLVRRGSQQSVINFTVVRDDVKLPSIYVRYFDGQIAYLRIAAFQEGTHTELLAKMGALKANLGPCRGIILDLRDNPGGLVSESIAVADEFLNKGPLFFTRHRGKLVEQVDTTSYGNFEKVPLVTMVDSGTASAAEIVAGALKDRNRSILVGNRTFGKGTVQSIIDLPGGAGLRLTTLRYYTPAGIGIQASGIAPHQLLISKEEKSSEILRESDLSGHLPSENLSGPTLPSLHEHAAIAQESQPCETPKPLLTLSQRIQQLPASPTNSSDNAIALAYKTILQQLNQHN
jgi:carboxyl-terminal processing protease